MVKRYHFDEDDRNLFGCRDGEYVDYEEYAKLKAERDELVEANKLLEDFARKVRDDSPKGWCKRLAAKVLIESSVTKLL